MHTLAVTILIWLASKTLLDVWHHGDLFAGCRAWLEARLASGSLLARHLLCPYCASFTVPLLGTILWTLCGPWPPGRRDLLAAVFMSLAATALLHWDGRGAATQLRPGSLHEPYPEAAGDPAAPGPAEPPAAAPAAPDPD